MTRKQVEKMVHDAILDYLNSFTSSGDPTANLQDVIVEHILKLLKEGN